MTTWSSTRRWAEPAVIWFGARDSEESEFARLGLACRFYGFQLLDSPVAGDFPPGAVVIVVLSASALVAASPTTRATWIAQAESFRAPIAVVGLDSTSAAAANIPFKFPTTLRIVEANPGSSLVAAARTPTETGYELRDMRFPIGAAAAIESEPAAGVEIGVLANIVSSVGVTRPVLLRTGQDDARRYLVTRITEPADAAPAPGSYSPSRFGATAPFFLLLRDVGGERCWQPPCALANLTIDDPFLTEPYGSLSYTGLLAEMRRERFHATIGFIPWNYDRNDPAVVALFRENPDHFSLAVHGNNHDRYEFFRYEARPGDNQRGKPLAVQTFNVRQAMARLVSMEEHTGLKFDRVMVFPHGICPADTLAALKRNGYSATFNYANVPLGEIPSADPAHVARAANAEWHGFPAVRRAYPEKYPEAAVAIDLFLGNPVLFMAHQDNFFGGIDAFTPHARRVNARQPAVRWTSLGEISRQLHLLRWLDDRRCEVRMMSRHAQLEHHRSTAAEFYFTKSEPEPGLVTRVTLDDADLAWTADKGQIHFAATLPTGSSALVEIHYRAPQFDSPITLDRSGLRRRALRLIADFRDLHLPRSAIGRLIIRRYYRGGKKRLTLGGLIARIGSFATRR